MRFQTFKNGDKIPALGLGTWKSKPGEVYEAIRTAINLGYRHFDCAFVYGNEKEIGEAFNDAFLDRDVSREDLFITSKLWNNRHRSEQIESACMNTLNDLKLHYLDLYLIHWPVVIADEVNYPSEGSHMISLKTTPLTETWDGMVALQQKGLAKHIGVSNFSIQKIKEVYAHSGVLPEMNQVEMHPFLQQNALKTYCDQEGIILTGYSPLGSADRPSNRIVDGEPKLFENTTIKNIAAELGVSPAQVILAWAVQRGTVVIPKSVNENRLKENLLAADLQLSAIQMQQMDAENLDYRYIKGDFWCLAGSDYTVEALWA